jgi:hypothetical protein
VRWQIRKRIGKIAWNLNVSYPYLDSEAVLDEGSAEQMSSQMDYSESHFPVFGIALGFV